MKPLADTAGSISAHCPIWQRSPKNNFHRIAILPFGFVALAARRGAMGGPFDGDEIFVCVSGEFVMDLVAADETAAVHSAEKHRNGSLLRVARREIVARPMFDAVARFGRL